MKRFHRKFVPFLDDGETIVADHLIGGPSDRIESNLGCDSAQVLLTDRALRFIETTMMGKPIRQVAAWPLGEVVFAGHVATAKAEWGRIGGRGKELVLRFEFADGQSIQGRDQPPARLFEGFKRKLVELNPQVR